MVRSRLVATLALASAAALSFGTATAQAAGVPNAGTTLKLSHPVTAAPAHGGAKLVGRYAALPFKGRPGAAAPNATATVPTWTGTATTGGVTYHYQMVGNNPMVAESNPVTNVPTEVVPVILKIQGHTYSPNAIDGGCGDTKSDSSLTMASPIFKKLTYSGGVNNSVKLGTGQFVDIFQRSEFWKWIGGASKINPGYHVNLVQTKLAAVKVTVPTASSHNYFSGCWLGGMDINWWDSFVQNTLIPQLAAKGVGPTTLPVFLFHNVVMFDSDFHNCCILGYHSAYATAGGTQTYANADFDSTSGVFDTQPDNIQALSHELGEWMDDPFVNNATPSWGNIGQVSGCQNNLEVGDPLTGTYYSFTINGYDYHPQEMAFESWFYHQSPSPGVAGWYSMGGTFTTYAASC